MQTLRVALADRSYPIHIGAGLLQQPRLLLDAMRTPRAAIITNQTVHPLYAESVAASLQAAGAKVVIAVLPDGEEHKTARSLDHIYETMLRARCDRQTTVIAIGGGVVGDLAGFAAATYMRGVPFIQVPTTLLAQVDSSVGGKTAINHPLGKNMIGAFHQPVSVLADIDTLSTLPDRELRAGLAEVIKHGLILDRTFFDWLEANIEPLLGRDPEALAHAVSRSIAIKAGVVAIDERETGPRALLNLGHTFGHAIEAGLGFGTWLHGEAVGTGMVMAADLSCRLGRIGANDLQRVCALVAKAGLPVQGPQLGTERYLELMSLDKKAADGRIRLILLDEIGQAAIVESTPPEALRATLEQTVG